jgi:hypothetical protein
MLFYRSSLPLSHSTTGHQPHRAIGYVRCAADPVPLQLEPESIVVLGQAMPEHGHHRRDQTR